MEQRTSSPVLRRPNNGDDGPDLCWALDGGKPGLLLVQPHQRGEVAVGVCDAHRFAEGDPVGGVQPL